MTEINNFLQKNIHFPKVSPLTVISETLRFSIGRFREEEEWSTVNTDDHNLAVALISMNYHTVSNLLLIYLLAIIIQWIVWSNDVLSMPQLSAVSARWDMYWLLSQVAVVVKCSEEDSSGAPHGQMVCLWSRSCLCTCLFVCTCVYETSTVHAYSTSHTVSCVCSSSRVFWFPETRLWWAISLFGRLGLLCLHTEPVERMTSQQPWNQQLRNLCSEHRDQYEAATTAPSSLPPQCLPTTAA